MTSACTLNSLKITAKAEILHHLYHLAKGAFQGSPTMLTIYKHEMLTITVGEALYYHHTSIHANLELHNYK